MAAMVSWSEPFASLKYFLRIGALSPGKPSQSRRNVLIEPWPLKVRITHKLSWFEGTAELYEPGGKLHRKHKVRGPLRCYNVVAGLAIHLSIDAFLLAGIEPPKRAPACPESKEEPVCHESPSAVWPEPPSPPLRAPEPTEKPREAAPVVFRLGAGVWADRISADRGSAGLTLDAGVRYGFFSVAGEAKLDPALGSTLVPDGGSVSFARATGAFLACAHYGWFAGCAKGEAGRILFPNSVPSQPARTYGAVGVRLGLEFPVVPWFSVRVASELLPTINPAAIVYRKQSELQVAGWDAGIGIGALFTVGKR